MIFRPLLSLVVGGFSVVIRIAWIIIKRFKFSTDDAVVGVVIDNAALLHLLWLIL